MNQKFSKQLAELGLSGDGLGLRALLSVVLDSCNEEPPFYFQENKIK
jgi:hypothetical protein